MNEKLIHDYWLDTGSNLYPDFTVEIQVIAGATVVFNEIENLAYGDSEQRTADVFDILGWMYSKMN